MDLNEPSETLHFNVTLTSETEEAVNNLINNEKVQITQPSNSYNKDND